MRKTQNLFMYLLDLQWILCLRKENYIIYSCTKYRNAKGEKSIKFNDKEIKIKWPVNKPMVSKKDKNAMSFTEFSKKYL